MREGELAQVLDDIWAKSSTRNWILGRLGVDSGTPEAIDVPGRKGYVVVSMGANGDQGITIAKDKAGVAKLVFQEVRMRRELGELVIREASAYAGGNGNSGGSDTLAGLSDVQLTSPASGNALQYNGTKWINVVPAGGAGGAPSPHAHESSHHTGLLNWTTVNKTGSSLAHLAERSHGDLDPATVTPDQHHAQVHALVSSDHTATGLTLGETVRATSATTFAWQKLLHTDLDPASIHPDQHHTQIHDILGPDHYVVANKFQIIGAIENNVLGLLTATHNPGATERLLKTNALGSLFLDTNLLYVDAANNWVGINKTPAGAALDIIASANGDHTQRIKQKTGQTGRMWRVEDLDGNELVVLDSVGNLQSGRPGFVSGLTGWQMTPQGNLEANNIWARGELHATVFVKDEVHATGGTLLVATAATVHTDAQIDSAAVDRDVFEVESTAAAFPGTSSLPLTIETTSSSFEGTTLEVEAIGNIIEINDPPSGPGLYFTPGEIVRVKTEVPTGITDMWFVVQSATQGDGYNILSVTKKSGSDGIIPKGAAIVSYGHPGDGRILMTSDWRTDEGYSPYIDVFNIGASPWTASVGDIIPRMRLGQLKGVGVPGVSGISQWGMIAGSDLTDANSGYLIASNLGIRMHKVPLLFNNGTADTGLWTADGNLRVGKNAGQDATTGFRIITTNETGREGDVVIGNEAAGNYLSWSQQAGILTVRGTLLVSDPSGIVTTEYVDTRDLYYDGLAQGYRNTAELNSKTYTDTHRVVKVSGTWGNAVAANTITWTGVEIFLANNTKRTVANSTGTAIAVRTYLYANLGLGGTLSLIPVVATTLVSDPNYVLIAVADIGANGDTKATVTVVGGGVYMSGGNIFAGSIKVAHISADAVEANQIKGGAVIAGKLGNLSVRNGDIQLGAVDTSQLADGAVSYAKVDPGLFVAMGGNRVMAIAGTFSSSAGNVISWTTLSILKTDSSTPVTVSAGTTSPVMVERNFFYISNTATGTVAMSRLGASSFASIPAGALVLAVGDLGPLSGKASITVAAGGTVISGDNIATGSVIADRLNVSELNAITVGSTDLTVTGNLIIGNITGKLGRIFSAGKTAYENATSGFFLGFDVADNGYRFDIGNSTNYLRWNGADLEFKTQRALKIRGEDVYGRILTFTNWEGTNTQHLYYGLVNGFSQLSFTGVLDISYVNVQDGSLAIFDGATNTARNVIYFRFGTGNSYLHYTGSSGLLTYSHGFSTPTLYITGASSPTSGSAGSPGEITWDASYIYVCTATNTWRRATLSAY